MYIQELKFNKANNFATISRAFLKGNGFFPTWKDRAVKNMIKVVQVGASALICIRQPAFLSDIVFTLTY